MIERFQNYIENESWDETLSEADDWLKGFCYAVMILVVLYFGGGYLHAWLTGRIGG